MSRVCGVRSKQSGVDVRLLGALPSEEIRDIYGAADMFCLTGLPESSGRVEGFGLVYLEAAAGGLPSIATAVGGVPDAVLADETGILVPPDVESISRAITELADDDDLRATARRRRQRPCAKPVMGAMRGSDLRVACTVEREPQWSPVAA